MEIAPAQNPATGPEFSELVRKIRDGDREAEEELVRRYQRAVAIIIRRRTNDSFAAEDLCQETFRLALEKIRAGELREAVKLSGFICGVARNLARDHFREDHALTAKAIINPPHPLRELITPMHPAN